MKITSLSAFNLKQQRFTHDMAAFTVFRGPNWSGKTSRIDAIHLALTGQHPRLPKTNEGVFRLASGPEMRVVASIDGVHGLVRTWERRGDKITALSVSDGNKCSEPFVPVMALDPTAYLAKSENERIKMVFGLVKLDESALTTAGLIAEMKRIKLPEHPEHAETVIAYICSDIEVTREATLQEFVAVIIAALDERFASANAAAKRFTGTQQTLDEQRAGQTVANVEESLTAARRKHAEAVAHAQRLTDSHATVLERTKRQSELRSDIAYSGAIALEYHEKKAKLEALRDAAGKYTPQIPALAMKRDNYHTQREQAAASVKTLEAQSAKIEHELKKVLACDTCPICREPGTEWKARYEKAERKTIDDNAAKIKTLRSEIRECEEVMEHLDDKIKAARAVDHEHDSQSRNIRAYEMRLKQLEPRIEDLRRFRVQLEGIGELPETTAIENEMREANAAVDSTHSQVAFLEGEHTQWLRAQAAKSAKAKAKQDSERVAVELEVTKQAKTIMLKVQSELVTLAFDKLLAVANKIAAPILDARLAYRDNRFGLVRNGSMAEPGTMSGAEERVALTALCIAIATQSPLKLVIIDELGTMDDAVKVQVVQTIRLALENGTIDQFVGADASAFDWQAQAIAAGIKAEDVRVYDLKR